MRWRPASRPQGQHYYPSFPYTSYRLMPPKALADLFAYIRTLAPVEGRAPPHELGFPFNIRRVVGGWKLLFFEGAPFRPDPSKSEEWNRGAYLVNGPGHCAECHSNRNALGAIVQATRFAGGPDPEGKGWVPNITQAENGLAKWSKAEIAELLKTGFTPSFDSVGGTMAAVVRNTAQLPEADRLAMAEYLKSLPAVQGPVRPAKTRELEPDRSLGRSRPGQSALLAGAAPDRSPSTVGPPASFQRHRATHAPPGDMNEG